MTEQRRSTQPAPAGASRRSSPATHVWRPETLLGSALIKGDFTDHEFAPHEHEVWAIGWIVDGANNFRRERGRFVAPAGSLCVVNPGEVHTGGGKHMAYWCLMPSPQLVQLAFPQNAQGALCTSTAVVQSPLALRAAQRMFRLDPTGVDALTHQAAAVQLLRVVLGQNETRAGSDSTAQGSRPLLSRAIGYLQDNLDRQVSLAELSDICDASAFQVCREFTARIGLSPGAFVRSRRVAQAQALISRGSELGGVAASCGFADQAHMTRVFRSVLGCTPAQWRGLA